MTRLETILETVNQILEAKITTHPAPEGWFHFATAELSHGRQAVVGSPASGARGVRIESEREDGPATPYASPMLTPADRKAIKGLKQVNWRPVKKTSKKGGNPNA